MEVGCLRHPGTSTTGSLLQDEDCTDGWQTVESGGEGGLLNTQYKVLLLPTTPINKLYNPKDKEPDSCSSIRKPLTTVHSYCLLHSLLLVNSVKIHLT